MEKKAAILCLFFVICGTTATEPPPMTWREALDFSWMVGNPVPYSIIKDILENVIKNFEGEKKQCVEKLEIDSKNRFENVIVESFVPQISLDVVDKTSRITIKKLEAPIALLQVKGDYAFEELTLPGGLVIYGKGKFKIRFDNLKASFNLDMKYSAATGLWKALDVGADASMEKFLFEFENLMYGEPMGDFLHSVINQMIPVVIELLDGLVGENKEPIMEVISAIMNNIMKSD